MYPYSNQAKTVRDTLVSEAKRQNVEFVIDADVQQINKTESGFTIKTPDKQYFAQKVIFANGNKFQKVIYPELAKCLSAFK